MSVLMVNQKNTIDLIFKMIRLGKQITTHLAAMKDVYNKLETLQAECAVTRTSRLTHSIISKVKCCQTTELINHTWGWVPHSLILG